jgi:metal-responsive CopG/Arc/MetJ family transcriptional regulator
MRTMSVSLTENLYEKLKHTIPSKKISKFVSFAITKELEKKEQELTLAYKNAEKDQERQNLLNDWDASDDFNER